MGGHAGVGLGAAALDFGCFKEERRLQGELQEARLLIMRRLEARQTTAIGSAMLRPCQYQPINQPQSFAPVPGL